MLQYLSNAAFSSTNFLQSVNACFKNDFYRRGNSFIENSNKKESNFRKNMEVVKKL